MENVELPLFYSEPAVIPARSSPPRARSAREGRTRVSDMHHRPSQLSGGQQQRIAIARALVNSPELLLADEPTGNLDTRTSIEIMGLFQALNDSGITVIMVTHELDIAAYCRRIVIMRDGRVLEDRQNPRRTVRRCCARKLDEEERNAQIGEKLAGRRCDVRAGFADPCCARRSPP